MSFIKIILCFLIPIFFMCSCQEQSGNDEAETKEINSEGVSEKGRYDSLIKEYEHHVREIFGNIIISYEFVTVNNKVTVYVNGFVENRDEAALLWSMVQSFLAWDYKDKHICDYNVSWEVEIENEGFVSEKELVNSIFNSSPQEI